MQNILTAIVNQDKGSLLDCFLGSLDLAVETDGKDQLDSGLEADLDVVRLAAAPPILSYAISRSSPACLEVLIARSLSTDCLSCCLVRTSQQEVISSVLLAASRANTAALQIILRSHPGVVSAEDPATGDKLLHLTARSREPGARDCLGLLLDQYGRDIEERNGDNKTPIYVAATGELEGTYYA